MTRVLSGGLLVALAVAVVWLAPLLVVEAVAGVIVVVASWELVALFDAGGVRVPKWPAIAGALLTIAAFAETIGSRRLPVDVVLMAEVVAMALVVLGGWRVGSDALRTISAALFPSLYVGLPIGAIVAIREAAGPAPLFLLMLTVMVSDTAQYYSGRLAGRRLLAPSISPKKTVEGAVGGFVLGTAAFVVAGRWWLPGVSSLVSVTLAIGIVAAGIGGDLFESMLKRSAGVKDSSTIIPGHGGVLDRLDALLFAAPFYYVVLEYV
jgi:phosphatidate cytidylyltransferase